MKLAQENIILYRKIIKLSLYGLRNYIVQKQ